uniref:Methyltransferase FkbM domain-containing protein n=1 Tax=Panagrolaimus sp. PS1159 TaxID=55785 RepID=A0AC35FNU4_9BILA
MSFPHCSFIGFDPNPDYEKLFVNDLGGKFVQTAVGGKSENNTIFQLQKSGYAKAPETQIRSAAELIETYHGKDEIIDILNIDIEGSEYGIFEEMLKDKIFENICQINVEIHPIWYHNPGYLYSEQKLVVKKFIVHQ